LIRSSAMLRTGFHEDDAFQHSFSAPRRRYNMFSLSPSDEFLRELREARRKLSGSDAPDRSAFLLFPSRKGFGSSQSSEKKNRELFSFSLRSSGSIDQNRDARNRACFTLALFLTPFFVRVIPSILFSKKREKYLYWVQSIHLAVHEISLLFFPERKQKRWPVRFWWPIDYKESLQRMVSKIEDEEIFQRGGDSIRNRGSSQGRNIPRILQNTDPMIYYPGGQKERKRRRRLVNALPYFISKLGSQVASSREKEQQRRTNPKTIKRDKRFVNHANGVL